MILIRIYYQECGGHTHMRIFSGCRGCEGTTRGKAGNLCMTNEEFAVFRSQSEGATERGAIEFVKEKA